MMRGLLIDFVRLSLWLLILAVIFVPLERWFALRPGRARRGAVATDIGFYFLSSLTPALLLGVPMAAVAALARRFGPPAYYAWVADWPFAAQLAAAFLIGEIGFYWGHRWTHRLPLLWRFHAVHHRPQHLDWLINTRAHPIDLIFTRLCGLTPLYILGLAQPQGGEGSIAAILVVLVGTLWGFFLHANVGWRLGPIEQVVASPRFHHWHHVREGPIDRNFASMLPLLDRVFGTLHLPGKTWPDAYGIGSEQAASNASDR